ncbi:MAG: Fic family protein [Acidobacteria bacterium]|nr:Fic family protein [Acidobacteriota bacterium]
MPIRTQKHGLDVTRWLDWFLRCLASALDRSEETLGKVLGKARFWESVLDKPLNSRQRLVLNRLLGGFHGKLTSSKWATLRKSSQDTASRDIDDLIRKGILARGPAGGRSTSYELILAPDAEKTAEG